MECGVLWEVCEWLCECWADRCLAAHDKHEPIHMLTALTAWYCSLDLPRDRDEVFDGPPILGRRKS